MPATAASTSTSDRSSMSKRRLRPPSSFVGSDENDAFNYAAGENTPLLISVSKDTTSNSATSTPTTYNASTTVSLSTSATNYTLGTTPGATNTSDEGVFPKHETSTQSQATKGKQSSYASYLETKAEVIELILSQPEIDLWKLRKHALTPGGLVNDSIRKRAWPKLVGLDHNYDPLQIEAVAKKTMCTGSTTVNTPAKTTTIEIDAQHELKSKTNNDDTPPLSTLIVESMDSAQIERDVARCTWHLLTGSQRGRRNQHRAITKAGKAAGNSRSIPNNPGGNKTKRQKRRKRHTAKYKRNRKVNALLKKKQHRLSNLINLTLAQSYDRSDKHLRSRHIGPNRLRYYQGYHDVASIFLHALGGAASTKDDEASNSAGTAADNNKTRVYRHYSSGDLELPSKVLCQVSFSHFKDALRSDFLRLQTGLRLVLFPLLSCIDREVHDHLLDADMEPFFCLSWILTWFSHDVRDTSLVKRLFDAFLVGHPSLPVYAALAMMTHPYNRRVILDTDCDFASLHQCLASLPKHSCKVGYKAQPVEGFDGVVVYVSDCEEEEPTPEDDVRTIGTAPSEMGDSQYTFDTQSQYTNENDSIYTESSFPISLSESQSQYSDSEWVPISGGAHASSHTAGILSGSYATSSNTNYNDDRTLISTEGNDFLSKESTLISGTWNDPDSPVDADTTNEPAQVLDDPNPVPFESILEKSLELIRDHPPRELVDLAKRYYQDDWDSQLSLISSNTNNEEPLDVQDLIGLLGPTPPQWSTTSSCTSDWVDKQKQRQDLGRKPTSRKDRRKKRVQQQMPPRPEAPLDLGESSEPCNDDEEAALPSSVDPMDYIRSNPHDPVVAAIGYGPGMEEKNRKRKLLRQKKRRRRRRRAMLIGCGVVTIGAIAVAMVMMNQRREANKIQTNEIQAKPKDMTETPQPLMRNLRHSNVDKAPKISSNSNSAVLKAANDLMTNNQQSSSSVLSMGRTSLSSVASTANTKRTPIAVLPTRDHLTTVRANKNRKLPALLVDPNRSIMDSKFNVTLIAVNINKVLHKMDEKFNVTLITVNINEALHTTKMFLWNNFVRHVWWLVSNGVLRPTKRLLKAIERSEVRADDIIH